MTFGHQRPTGGPEPGSAKRPPTHVNPMEIMSGFPVAFPMA